MRKVNDPLAGPNSLTILPTYTCTAQCKECCFECSPHIKGRLSFQQIIDRINKAHAAFPFLQLVCFSGGECFILGKDLDKSIAHATSLGLVTRCVSNGYWAPNQEGARKRIDGVAAAGLKELNLSTGDEHQQWVPFESVANAAIAAAGAGIQTLIVVEGSREARFHQSDVLAHPAISEFLAESDFSSNLRVFENVWMTFHSDMEYTHEERTYKSCSGCTNILDNFVATPSGQMAACCGLTMEHIPELKTGDGDIDDFATMYENQLADFLKIWISVDGPKKILQFAAEKDSSISVPISAHPCEACALLYKRPEIQKVLLDHYEEKVADVFTRFYLSRAVRRAAAAQVPQGLELHPQMFGA